MRWPLFLGFLAGLLAGTAATPPPPILIWNLSTSAPPGLYAVGRGREFAHGDMVAAHLPSAWRRFAGARRYIPVNVPLIKRVAARRGDRICSSEAGLKVNDILAARRRQSDGAGRPMPFWTGCRRLGPGEYLLLMDKPDSFDGRYFGPTRSADIIGRAKLLWARR